VERDKNKSHLNLELTNALSSWQKMPDSKEYLARVSEAIMVALAAEGLLLKVKREVLDKFGTSELPIIRTVAFRYGCVDGNSIVFESSQELSMRVGAIRERSYLFLDSRTEKTIGFFRPEDILELKTK